MIIGRRAALLGLSAVATMGGASLALAAAPGEKRFVVVIQRGAMDGMAAVVPHGDPGLTALRGATSEGLLDLGGFYGLHPALAGLHAMYQAHELLPVHAVAGPYRVRSHFEAQDFLESGADHRMTSGWLNRAVGAMGGDALAVGVSVPLLLRGSAQVGNWAPHGMAEPPPDLYAAIAAMNQTDPLIGPAIVAGLKERGFSNRTLMGEPRETNRNAFPALAASAGAMLRAPDGPRIAAMEIGGWDTHTAQVNRLTGPLKQLDAGMVALKTALGDAWHQTVVLVMTEFGRTARLNGTGGTDHGTAGVAFVLGGAVKGGRVQADWPGLGPGKLFEDRDLAPTADLRSVAKGLLAGHLGLGAPALEQVFPGSAGAVPMRGLLA
jgi:uncharacterized protein (DUF1501 family)